MEKLRLITEIEEKIELGTLNEDDGSKTLYIEGIYSTIGIPNRNKRIYPKEIWENNVKEYQKEIQEKTINSLMEWEHPTRVYVDPIEAIARTVELKIEGNKVIGKSKFLETPKAQIVKQLFLEGVKIGVSSRGVGEVGDDGVVKKFKLICYDVVASPSDYNAYPKTILESFVDGIYKDKFFKIDETTGLIVECNDEKDEKDEKDDKEKTKKKVKKLSDFEKKKIEEFVLRKIKEILKK